MVYKPRFSKPAQDLHAQNLDNIFDALVTSTSSGSGSTVTDVKYNNVSFGSPIPMVSISYSGNHNGAGASYGVYRITLTGRSFAGTAPSSGSGGSGGSVLNNLYNWPDGKILAITVCGVTKSYYNCKVVDESYSETSDHWASTIAYTVVMESHVGSASSVSSGSSSSGGSGNGSIVVSYNESWSEEPIEDGAYARYSYSTSSSSSGTNLGPVGSASSSGGFVASVGRTRITHRLSVKATNPANPSLAWAEAKRIAHRDIGNSRTSSGTSSGTTSGNSSGSAKYNRYQSISYDINEGTYEITENWIESPNPYIIDYNVEKSADNRGIITVRVQGQIQGMTDGYIGTSGNNIYDSAKSGFNSLPSAYTIANSITAATLNTRLVSSSEGHNISKGTISFSYEYDTTPFFIDSSGITILSENVSITDTGATDVFSEVQVLGRALGPVIQDLGTKTSYKKDISIEVVIYNTGTLSISGPPSGIKTAVQNLIDQVEPFSSSGESSQGFAMLTSDNSTWSPTEARFSRAVSWTYSYCSTANLP